MDILPPGIYDIPEEVLARVLVLSVPYIGTPQYESRRRVHLSSLLAVSRRFRSLTIAASELWNRIIIYIHPRDPPKWSFIEACLRWSNGRLLEISIRFKLPRTRDVDIDPRLMAILIPHACRWGALSISCNEHFLGEISSRMLFPKTIDCPNLWFLELPWMEVDTSSTDKALHIYCDLHAPEVISVDGAMFTKQPPSVELQQPSPVLFSNVSRLTLHAWKRRQLRLIEGLPNLMVLKLVDRGLHGFSFWQDDDDPIMEQPNATLPRLRYIFVTSNYTAEFALSRIIAPCLTALAVVDELLSGGLLVAFARNEHVVRHPLLDTVVIYSRGRLSTRLHDQYLFYLAHLPDTISNLLIGHDDPAALINAMSAPFHDRWLCAGTRSLTLMDTCDKPYASPRVDPEAIKAFVQIRKPDLDGPLVAPLQSLSLSYVNISDDEVESLNIDLDVEVRKLAVPDPLLDEAAELANSTPWSGVVRHSRLPFSNV